MTQKPRNRITQQDVARLAGVSVAAVSLVLGGKGRISPQGVERIYHAIDQLGYRSPSSSSVTPLPRIGVLLMPGCQFATDLLPDLSQGLQGAGFSLLLSYANSRTLLEHAGQLLAQDVRGIIVCGKLLNASPEMLKALSARAIARHVALIGVGEHYHPGPVTTVHPNNAQAAHQVVEAFLHQQHCHIAYLGGESHSLVRAERLGGLSLALGKSGVAFSPSLSQPCAATFEDGFRATAQLLKQNPKISAILCDNPTVLLAAHYALAEGLQTSKWRLFSRRIVLAGFGKCEELVKQSLPQILPCHDALTARAIECLHAQLAGDPLLPDDPRLTVAPTDISPSLCATLKAG